MTEFFIHHKDPYGNIKQTISDWFHLEYAKNENDFGSLSIDVRPDIDINLFRIDDKFELYRAIPGGIPYLELETCWFIRLVRSKIDEQGQAYTHILCHDALELADRRIVAYNASTTYSDKTAPIDDMMKAIMRENFGSLATDSARDISAYLTIPSNVSLAPSIKDTFPRQKILPLLQALASKSNDLGTYLSFDIIKSSEIGFTFMIYIGARGKDRGMYSGNPLTFSIANGNASYSTLSGDYTEERNYVYAGGQGEENNRVIQTAYDTQRINLSPFNRREDWIDVTSSPDPQSVLAGAQKRLEEARPKIAVNVHIQQIEECQYGIHYNFGDIVVVRHGASSMDVHVDSLHNVVDPSGGESLTITGRNLEDNEY